MSTIVLSFELTLSDLEVDLGLRLDQWLAKRYPEYSRVRWHDWIQSEQVLVNHQASAVKYKVKSGDIISAQVQIKNNPLQDLPQPIPLNIVYEDESLLIINKPAGLVVHPAAGNRAGTLLNALLHHAPELANLPRAGIVHRLDKETSGLLMIGRTLQSYTYLVKELQQRNITREYSGLATGRITAGNTIDAPLGRHPRQRTKMAVLVMGGKPSVTHFRVAERFQNYTLLNLKLETGRTHQIRVHLAHIKHPLVGDPAYGGRLLLPAGAGEQLREFLRHFKRQALHACKLGLTHPTTQEYLEWTAPLPADFTKLLGLLREHNPVIAIF
jgi:23S rRNA pseudouridine1911/1915/1917 synthase